MAVARWPNSQAVAMMGLLGAVIIGLVLCYLLATPFIPALVGSFALAVIFVPLDARLRLKLRSHGLAAALCVTIIALIVVVPTLLVIGTLIDEITQSAPRIAQMVDADHWNNIINSRPWLSPLLRVINERFDIPDLAKAGAAWMAGWSGTFVQGSFSSAVSMLMTFYILFYLLRDREMIRSSIAQALPLSASEFARLSDRVVNTIFATVFGLGATAALQGVLGGLMFWWLGFTAPLFWGVVMGMLAVVPFLGAFVIWAPAALFLGLSGDLSSAVILGLWGTLVVGLVDNAVYPVLVGQRLRLHTVISFIAIVGGLILLGAPGVVLGPVIVSVTIVLTGIWRERVNNSAPEPSEAT